MKYIKKFKSVDFVVESMVLESAIHYSPKFRQKVQRVFDIYRSRIAREILYKEGGDIKQDWTLIDSSLGDDISFINMKNANKLIKNGGYDIDLDYAYRSIIDEIWDNDIQYNDTGVTKRSRNNIKIGKFVKKVFGYKFTDKEIEEFVNQFKSVKETSEMEFKLVSGDEISKWYNPENTKNPGRGTLGNSCMSSNSKNNFFSIYTKNPEVCKLLILLEDGKLVGRALVWKINKIEAFEWSVQEEYYIKDKNLTKELSKFEYFMDRVYTSEDYLINNFHNYANSQNWLTRYHKSIHNNNHISYKGEKVYVKMSVKVKKLNYEPYPYLDTFKRYNHFNGTLNNDEYKKKGGHILTSTQGDYKPSISKSKYYVNRFKDLFF